MATLSAVRGPWACCYFQRGSGVLWFGRDAAGHRSLLLHAAQPGCGQLCLASVAGRRHAAAGGAVGAPAGPCTWQVRPLPGWAPAAGSGLRADRPGCRSCRPAFTACRWRQRWRQSLKGMPGPALCCAGWLPASVRRTSPAPAAALPPPGSHLMPRWPRWGEPVCCGCGAARAPRAQARDLRRCPQPCSWQWQPA